MIRVVSLLATFAATSGCTAGLNVQVDVMNPAYARAAVTEVAMLGDANELARGEHVRAERALNNSVAQVLAFRSRCFDLIVEHERAVAADTNAPQLVRENSAENVTDLDAARRNDQAARTELAGLRAQWATALYNADSKARADLGGQLAPFTGLSGWNRPANRSAQTAWFNPLSDTAKSILATREIVYDTHAQLVAREIAKQRQNCLGKGIPLDAVRLAQVDDAQARATERVDATSAGIVGNGLLLNQLTEAFFVTSAGEEAWAPQYNRAVGRGNFGNTSIALKMNDTADFSIKGFVFDGRSTADMVKKVATQTIATIAGVYGAPISISGPQGDKPTSTSFDASKLLAGYQTKVVTARAEQTAYRSALFQIADAVSANFDSLATGNGDAANVVTTTIDANKARWTEEGE